MHFATGVVPGLVLPQGQSKKQGVRPKPGLLRRFGLRPWMDDIVRADNVDDYHYHFQMGGTLDATQDNDLQADRTSRFGQTFPPISDG